MTVAELRRMITALPDDTIVLVGIQHMEDTPLMCDGIAVEVTNLDRTLRSNAVVINGDYYLGWDGDLTHPKVVIY